MKVNSCGCAVCESAKSRKISEYDLHVFVGLHEANKKGELRSFENNMNFASVTHWDIGFCGRARYYIYRDDRFNAIAWYDIETSQGFN